MAQHAVSVPIGRHRRAHTRRAASLNTRAVLVGALVGLALLACLAVGHNVNVYRGQDALVGVTWGHVGGCEVDQVDNAVSVGCWFGGRD